MQHTGPKEGLREGRKWMKSVLMFNIACEIQLKNIRKLDTEEHHVGTEAVRSKK